MAETAHWLSSAFRNPWAAEGFAAGAWAGALKPFRRPLRLGVAWVVGVLPDEGREDETEEGCGDEA
jgi:hypothetical protein